MPYEYDNDDDFDGELVDDFDFKTPRNAQRNRPNWVGNLQLGQLISFDPDTDIRATVLKMQNYGPPVVRTVSLWVDWNEDTPASEYEFSLIAEVNAGCGGAVQTFEVDWHNGACFTIPCSSLEVVCRYENKFGQFDPPEGLKVSAMIGSGVGRSPYPTRTLGLSTAIPAGSADLVEVPRFARKLRLIDLVETSPTLTSVYDALNTIIFSATNPLSGTLVVNASYVSLDRDFALIQGMPIPNGARWVYLENNTSDLVYFLWEFELGL